MVLQDVTADAMTVEVVDRSNKTEETIRQELAMVQLLGRLSLSVGMFAVAGLGGWLAQLFSYQNNFFAHFNHSHDWFNGKFCRQN